MPLLPAVQVLVLAVSTLVAVGERFAPDKPAEA
jgi:hypothetical protein